MTDLKEMFKKELAELKRFGEDFKKEAKKGGQDLKQAFKSWETRWPEVEEKITELEKAGSEAINQTATELGKELKRAYKEVKETISKTDKPSDS